MKIKVRARHAYGVLLLDPINEAAMCLAAIAGTKTLTVPVLATALRMGAEVDVADSTDAQAIVNAIDDARTALAKVAA